MLPNTSKITAKIAQVGSKVANVARSAPRVVSSIMDSPTNPPTSWKNPNAEYIKAVEERIHSNLGSVADHEMCARAAQNALLGSSGHFKSATDWQGQVPKSEWHSYDPKQTIPAGVAVFYPSSNPHGHVAVSMGGGKVYTTDAFGKRSGIVEANKVFGSRSPIGWTDWAGRDLGTDEGREVIGLDNRAGFSPSRPSSETGYSRRESFGSSIVGGDYTNTSSVGSTPGQLSKRGVFGLDVDTSS